MIKIKIPNFAKMRSADLHAWEFKVYDRHPGTAELPDLIGKANARAYYRERARRFDLKIKGELLRDKKNAAKDLLRVQRRLARGTSLRVHFRGLVQ